MSGIIFPFIAVGEGLVNGIQFLQSNLCEEGIRERDAEIDDQALLARDGMPNGQ
jgi:hypothetical protein